MIDWHPLEHGKLNTSLVRAPVPRSRFRFSHVSQMNIWNAGASEDYSVTIAATNEPLVVSMVPGMESLETGDMGFRPANAGVSAYDLWQVHKEKSELRRNYLDHWEKTVEITGTRRPVDAIIAPTAAYAAPPHGHNRSAPSCHCAPTSKLIPHYDSGVLTTPWFGMFSITHHS